MMADGYGFGAEGDWKVAAMDVIMKSMAEGMTGGTAFMEDYTYHLEKGNEHILGAHMLEVCPLVAADKPKFRYILLVSAVRAILQDLYLTQRTVTQSLLRLLIWEAECV